MATLTKLESKIAEVLGLAQASRVAAETVSDLLEDDTHAELIEQLGVQAREAQETAKRCTAVAGTFDRKRTAILAAARETRDEAVEMMETYLEGEDDPLDGFEFLIMAEAGEVGHWLIVAKLNQRAGDAEVQALTDWALPVQEGHFKTVTDGALVLAGAADPGAEEH
ncbi:hypothetical protein [Conexibacter woesei]|uniref:hypothetical protein n=1 Tax=Conexibacter woesei TaxID=191495 RepID=UPI0004148EF7|nr:hypothetical protein [Conexibacter woesei]